MTLSVLDEFVLNRIIARMTREHTAITEALAGARTFTQRHLLLEHLFKFNDAWCERVSRTIGKTSHVRTIDQFDDVTELTYQQPWSRLREIHRVVKLREYFQRLLFSTAVNNDHSSAADADDDTGSGGSDDEDTTSTSDESDTDAEEDDNDDDTDTDDDAASTVTDAQMVAGCAQLTLQLIKDKKLRLMDINYDPDTMRIVVINKLPDDFKKQARRVAASLIAAA